MSALEGERARLEEILRRPPPSPVRLHPPLAESHRRRVASLAAWLEQEEGRTEALEIIRSRIERVAITPLEGGGFEIGIEGEARADGGDRDGNRRGAQKRKNGAPGYGAPFGQVGCGGTQPP